MMRTSLAKRLRVLRVERSLTLRQAAEKAGVRAGTLSGIERGEHVARDATLGKIARAYDVPVEDLLEEPRLEEPSGAPASAATGKAEALELEGISDVDELARIARALKAEWRSLAEYERVRQLSPDEHRKTMRRLEEIEHRILEAKQRAEGLRKRLEYYEDEGVFELAATP